MRGVACDDHTRAAVMAALLAGQRVSEVAKAHGLHVQTVHNWRKALSSDQLIEVSTKKRVDFGEMLAGYLEECITTLRQQVVFFRTESWLSEQDASSAAVLHGVLADKTILLLRAAEDAANASDPESP